MKRKKSIKEIHKFIGEEKNSFRGDEYSEEEVMNDAVQTIHEVRKLSGCISSDSQETDYLLYSLANAAHLEKSIDQLKQGKIVKRKLIDS